MKVLIKIFVVVLFYISASSLLNAHWENHLRKCEEKDGNHSIPGIDFIYMINLKERVNKWEESLRQLAPYNIYPYHFDAINGWKLSKETLKDLGYPEQFSMIPGKEMNPGKLACLLSHLSVLKDAYESNYKTIWVLEDDIEIIQDPRQISSLISSLDFLVCDWDILFTDLEHKNEFGVRVPCKAIATRPNIIPESLDFYLRRTPISDTFLEIKMRYGTHSMILRRSGIEKILNYFTKYGLYLPIDMELTFVPGLKQIVVQHDIVSTRVGTPSDTFFELSCESSSWDKFKLETSKSLAEIPGWGTKEKMQKLMDLIYETKPKVCVEIGAFAGATTYPIARTLRFLGNGVLSSIDAWSTQACLEGLDQKDPNAIWWSKLDIGSVHQQFMNLIEQKQLSQYCAPLCMRSDEAVDLFLDNSIDFLYIDGNFSYKGSMLDVVLYFPKVKKGGYIWLDSADFPQKKKAVEFLKKNCEWLSEKSIGNQCLLFKKL